MFSSCQLGPAIEKLWELKNNVLITQKKYEEEFFQLLKLQEEVEQLECQKKSQNQIYLQIMRLEMKIKEDWVMLDVAQVENQNLKQQVEKLIFDAMVLQKELISKEAISSGAIEKLQAEHVNSQQHIKDLEARLEGIQGSLLSKLKALDAIQEKNASLQQEIATLRNTLGCGKGTEVAQCRMPSGSLQFQQTPDSKPSITLKSSEKVLYSRFAQSGSTVTLFPGKSLSKTVKFPIASLLTLDKSSGISNFNLSPQKQYVSSSSTSNTWSDLLGEGQDYVTALFADTKKTGPEAEKVGRSHLPSEYYNSTASSAVGNLKIVDVHSGGHYVKIVNTSCEKEEGIGDYTLQQNQNGHPLAIYRFPPRIRMKANSSVTVWAMNSNMPHKPPTDYLWKNIDKFKSGPEYTTILCNPGGQAVAWYTPLNRNRKESKEDEEDIRIHRNLMQPIIGVHQQQDRWETRTFDTSQGNTTQLHTEAKEPDFILREEKVPPTLFPVQNAWCQNPSNPTHPHYSVGRYLPQGSGRSQSCGQTRTQPVPPSPDPGVLYTGGSCVKPATGDGNRKSRVKPTRSVGPNLGGVIYVGSAIPIGSALEKYFAHSSCHFRLLAQASLAPINIL
ncbi:lamin tail domain-containing protein 1 isoform X1 [Pogona vitticeps]